MSLHRLVNKPIQEGAHLGRSSATKNSALVSDILEFIQKSSGLEFDMTTSGMIQIHQSVDGKISKFDSQKVIDVLQRQDSDGKNFIQINFEGGLKVLLTDTLVGFKPKEIIGLDMAKLPKVVTTPDLNSVFEAIEESLSSDLTMEHEIDLLKKVYQSILYGGETVGFDLTKERKWFVSLTTSSLNASA